MIRFIRSNVLSVKKSLTRGVNNGTMGNRYLYRADGSCASDCCCLGNWKSYCIHISSRCLSWSSKFPRRLILFTSFIFLFTWFFSVDCSAASYSTYDGSFNSTYVSYASDIASKHVFKDHVFWRNDEREYILAIGDLIDAGGVIRSDGEVELYIFYTPEYSSYLRFSTSSDSSLTLSPGDKLIYSSVGGYPSLVGGDVIYETISAVLLGVLVFSYLIRFIFFSRSR